MRSKSLAAIVLATLLGLMACSRDPNVVKKRYFESGNKYFANGRYKEASIQYRNALKRDQRYGPAHYKLALTNLKVNDVGGAVNELRKSIELLPKESPDHWDAVVRLCEIYLAVAKGEKTYMDEVEGFTKELLSREPNSFDAHRLIGDIHYTRATEAYKTKGREDVGKKELEGAIAEYRRADSIKGGQQGVSMQLARALAANANFADAEQLYRRVMEKEKSYQFA